MAVSVNAPRNVAGIATTALAFVALALLLDGPVWLVKLVPTQDGPVHLAQADLIARFGWGGTLEGPAAYFYQWNPRIEPNSAIYLLLAGLIRLTGDALIAHTLFLSLYGLLWIVAAYAVSRVETERPLLPMLLLLPLAFGVFIHWGFYNFALGVPLFLLFASFWRRARDRGDALTFIATALFLAALYLTHITSVVAACLLLAADGVARAIDAFQRAGLRAAARRLTIDGIWSAAAALPVLLLIASFLLAYQNIPGEPAGIDGGMLQILRRIVAATHLFTFSRWEVLALAPLLAAMLIAGVTALRQLRSADLLWPAFFVLVVLLSLLNLKTGSALLSERLAPYSFIAVVLAVASRQPAVHLVRTLCAAAIAIGRDNPGTTFANADLIALHDSHLFAWRVRPTIHAAQTAALTAHGVGLSSSLPSTRYFGYFPLQYQEAHDFMRATSDWEGDPSATAVAKFRDANLGAPRALIVSSSDEDGSALARKLGYGDCRERVGGGRTLAACKISSQQSAMRD